MKATKKENTTNQNINLQADTLTDLPLADERADETKGGAPNRSTGDANGDGFDDIIVGTGTGAMGHIK